MNSPRFYCPLPLTPGVLATVLGGGSVAFYLLRLMGSTEPGLTKVGLIGMLSAPPVLVALVLSFVVTYLARRGAVARQEALTDG